MLVVVMDPDICRWILEDVMRSAAPEGAVKKLLRTLQVPVSGADSRFEKTVLLRNMQDDVANASVTEKMLDNLESMEKLTRDEGAEVPEALKAAYCKVAVECTVKFLAGGNDRDGKYCKAVERVWEGRIGGLMRWGSGLVTPELREWRDDVKAAITDPKVARMLENLNTRNLALKAVRDYVGEAWALLGPTFLQLAAAVTELDGFQRSDASVAVRNGVDRVEEAREKSTPKADRDLGELVSRDTDSPIVVHLEAERVNQVEELAGKSPNAVDLDAEMSSPAEKVPANVPDVVELETETVKQVEEQAANMRDVVEMAANKVNRVEELAGNISNVGKDAGELSQAADPLASNTQNVGQDMAVRSRPEMGERGGRGLVASQGTSWDLIVEDRAAAGRVNEIRKRSELPRRKHAVRHKRSKGGVEIADTEEVDNDVSCSRYDSVPTSVVNEVREALRSSSSDLRAVVNDPLPDALRLAETVISDMVRKDKQHEPSAENQGGKDIDAPIPSVNGGVEPAQTSDPNRGNQSCSPPSNAPRPNLRKDKQHEPSAENQGGKDIDAPIPSVNGGVEPSQTSDPNRGNQSCSPPSNAPRPNLMERNRTARTYEWDDSIDDSPEGRANRASRLHLPSPKRRLVSPLKKQEATKFARRRPNKRWSLLEEDTLRNAVQKYGKGNWKLILNSHRDIFEERTEVDLKDKWRNMSRY